RELLEDARPPARAHDDAAAMRRLNRRTQDHASQHQRIGVRRDRDDAQVDALEAGGRPLEVAVIDGEHHRAAALGPEYARETVLHPPVVSARALEEETLFGRRR